MYDLKKVIPDTNPKKASGAELISQMIIFYIGVALFITVCMIPPFTIILPFMVPIVFITCAFVNLGLFVKFLQATDKETKKLQKTSKKSMNR